MTSERAACSHVRRQVPLLRVAALLLVSTPLAAIDQMTLDLGDWTGFGMRAHGITVELTLPDSSTSPLRLSVASLNLGVVLGKAHHLQIYCAKPVIKAAMYGCAQASIQADFEKFGRQSLSAAVNWQPKAQRLEFSADGLTMAGGNIVVRGEWRKAAWSLNAAADGLSVSALRKQLGALLPIPKNWTLQGKLSSVHIALSGTATLAQAHIETAVADLDLGNPDGMIAAQRLKVALNVDLQQRANAWRMQGRILGTGGELLVGRLYWNFSPGSLKTEFSGAWQGNALVFDTLKITLGTVLRATGRATLDFDAQSPLRQLIAEVSKLDLGALPAQTRAGLLLGSMVSKLEGRGHLSGHFEIEDGVPAALDLTLAHLDLADHVAGLAIDGLDGHLVWHSTQRALFAGTGGYEIPGELHWQGANFYGLAVGGAQIRFTTNGSDFRLLQAVRIPLLDGGLRITSLQFQRLGDAQMSIRFDGAVEPISMPLLCKAFGWPVFAGTLAGAIPQLSLEHGEMTLGGQLNAQVFDGGVTVSTLTISDAFGARPRLKANVAINRLDLAAVTGAFSFGQITGRLSGRIDELQLVGWEPTAFDASLYSTPGDRSKKRISQRAVENITSIGGGVGATAALERGALRFFKEFHYQQLGLSCKLANDVCALNGVEAHSTGYYLVKGSGIPRIDVIGEARRVDWRRMVASLKELSKSQATVTSP